MPDPIAVNSMFGRIARRYDLANFILCGGIDTWWRKKLVSEVRNYSPREVLDLATGSGDVAFALSRKLPPATRITGMDFCEPMLREAEAKQKAAGIGRYSNVTFRIGDGMALPLEDSSCDTVTISFGLRNLANRQAGLREMRRVLRAGGHLFVLEFSQPHPWFRPLYFWYLRNLLPRLAGLVTGDKAAYQYLNNTISEFPGAAALGEEMKNAGFKTVHAIRMTLGVVALHHAEK
jgi:demethylmenaquinone methyltransferase / 2-methoxy-6-polyprenyl-1,4-benzoquinol methylase